MSTFDGLIWKYGEYAMIYMHAEIRNSPINFRYDSCLRRISGDICILSCINLPMGDMRSPFFRNIFHDFFRASIFSSRKRYFWLFSSATAVRKLLFLYCFMILRIFLRETILIIERLYERENIWAIIFIFSCSYTYSRDFTKRKILSYLFPDGICTRC